MPGFPSDRLPVPRVYSPLFHLGGVVEEVNNVLSMCPVAMLGGVGDRTEITECCPYMCLDGSSTPMGQ